MASVTRKKPSKVDQVVLRAAAMTDKEADDMLGAYGAALTAIMRIRAQAKDDAAALKKKFEDGLAPFIASAKAAEEQLEIWATAHRKRLTDDGATKTVKLPAGEMKWRDMPAAVKLRRGVKEDEIVALAIKERLGRFTRVKYELNREAMLAEPEAAKLLDGVSIKSAGEEFYLRPAGVELTEFDE
ncbi:MAG: host-nuclease inhibitor Gam family protein [Rhizomicrobium sp.]